VEEYGNGGKTIQPPSPARHLNYNVTIQVFAPPSLLGGAHDFALH